MRPTSELHATFLFIKWKEFNADLAIALVDGGGFPMYPTVVINGCLSHDGHGVVAIRTRGRKSNHAISGGMEVYKKNTLKQRNPNRNYWFKYQKT